MKICCELKSESKLLGTLQELYAQHLKLNRTNRLKWLERTIDTQQQRVVELTHMRDDAHPWGCMDCEHVRRCPCKQADDLPPVQEGW